jgi:hypothetical protein
MSGASHLIYDGDTGRWQYVIGTGSSEKHYTLRQVEYMADLHQLQDRSTLVQVKHAYLDDPTVNVGWAIYGFDSNEKNWFKIAEQESMDSDGGGPGGDLSQYATFKYVDDLNKLVRDDVNANSERITKIEDYLSDCDDELNRLSGLIG